MREHFVVSAIRSREVCRAQRPVVGHCEDALKALEQGKAELGELDGKQFFEALLQITMQGFFSDPIYGGNRNKVAWKMVGFPGLPATYANLIEAYREKRYVAEPQSIADFS